MTVTKGNKPKEGSRGPGSEINSVERNQMEEVRRGQRFECRWTPDTNLRWRDRERDFRFDRRHPDFSTGLLNKIQLSLL